MKAQHPRDGFVARRGARGIHGASASTHATAAAKRSFQNVSTASKPSVLERERKTPERMSNNGSKNCPNVSFDEFRVKVGISKATPERDLTRQVVATITP